MERRQLSLAMRMRIFAGLATTLAFAAAAADARDIRIEQVRFGAGQSGTTIDGRITGYESVSYQVGAEAGQRMSVSLAPSNLATYFNVYAPGQGPGDEAIANSGLTGPMVPDINRFEATLPASGQYTVSVYMMRSAARRGERSDYTLDISVAGALQPVVTGDFADGLQGGPDFWQVVTGGGPLNVRADPSVGAAPRGQVADGATLRNSGGCRMAEGRRWCAVATPDGSLAGWAAGDFLREGADPG